MKIRFLVLLLVLVVSLLCSCQPKHTHSFSDTYSGDDVYHWFECDCGEKDGYEQHAWNNGSVTKQPTVEEEGERTFTCTVCRATKVAKIDKLSPDHTHEYSIVNYDDTHHWNECECGEKGAKALHSFDEGKITTHPTTESEGERTFECTGCEYKKTEKVNKLDPDHTHSFNTNNNDEHSHWVECVCGERDNIVKHSFSDGVVTTPLGATSAGVKTYNCTVCGRMETEILVNENSAGMSFLKSTHYKMSNLLEKTPLTLEAEIKVDQNFKGRAGAIFGNYYGIRQDWLFEIYENGVPRFYYVDASGNIKDYMFTEVDVRTGEWMHIAFTFDYANRTMSVYINGQVAQTLACDSNLAEDTTRYPFVVAGDNRSNNGIFFQGKIRSIAAYSDIRTTEEISRSVEKGVNLYADDLLVAYLLDESCEGEGIKDATGKGQDIPKEWLDSHETTLDYAYSFAVVGDTQWMNKYTPAKMEGIYDWIVANVESKKIAHVFGLGDITEEWGNEKSEAEWIRAQNYIFKMNGVVSYSLVRGNHDESTFFDQYFANEAYMGQFGGYYMVEGDIRNAYKTMTIGQTDYLFMVLDFGASDEMLEWANQVVLAHPDHRVVVTTHGYQGFDNGHLNYDNVMGSGGIQVGSDVDYNGARGYNDGKAIWEKFVSKHPNIFLVLSGHTPMEDLVILQSEGEHGNTVNQLIVDAQWMDPQKDGVGMVCMLYFSEDGTQMEVEWISTDTGKYYKEQNQFTWDLTNSLNASAHDFKDSYNDKTHHKACECGYIHSEEAHAFDGGVLNAEGFMVYSCECGYKRVASATDDPIALELQALLEKIYNGGVYFKEASISTSTILTLYNGEKFWVDGSSDVKVTSEYLSLADIILGKYGNQRLDLGWNYYNGVYSSANADTVNGVAAFVGVDGVTKVTVEEKGAHVIIKLYANESLLSECTIGLYATTILTNHAGSDLGTIYTKTDENGMCHITPPAISGCVAEYDYIILDSRHSELTKTVYYTTVAVWDGVSVSTSLKGSGTAEDPFLIENGADLAYIAKEVNKLAVKSMAFSNKYFKMTQSIDLNGHELYIGKSSIWAERQIFAGFFDGNHCTIRGLKNTKSLFAAVEGGYVKNLSVYGQLIGEGHLGGVAGYLASNGVLENITSYVTITGVNTIGGIVANAENNASTVLNCVNYGNVTGSSWNVGGIAGSGGHNISGCVNFGDVKSTGSDNVGGIAGTTKNTGSISNCINYGNISTIHGRAGGIVGLGTKPIVNCVNYGNVTAGWDSAGILGYVGEGASASVSGCVNYGNVSGGTGMGGIFGFNHANAGNVVITNCVNYGSVSGTWGVGGIAGNTKAEVSGCVNNGTLNAKGELGGIVGRCYGMVTNCINNGAVVGTVDIIGGIVGHLFVVNNAEIINTGNTQQGTVTGPNAKDIIGKIG